MLWFVLFIVFCTLIVLDLGLIHRKVREISLYEAMALSAFWISMGLGFAVFIYFAYARQWFGNSPLDGHEALLQYLTAFSLEKMLSLDNLFVMALIFHHLRIPVPQQHRVLFLGIILAIVLRGIFILAGMYLLGRFEWMSYVFAALLLFSAFKMLGSQADNENIKENILIRWLRKLAPVDNKVSGNHFFHRVDGRLVLTPLIIALIMVESADVMFAMDSIPAVIAVSRDPFIVYSSNVFAILGLRALYFVLATALRQFRYLKLSMVMILIYIGIKMLLSHLYPVSALTSLLVICTIMFAGILASLLDKRHGHVLATSPVVTELGRVYAMTFAGIKRITILLIGTSVVIVGIVMIFTPGPAIVVIPAGLAILASEFVWARRMLQYSKQRLIRYQQGARNYLRRKKPYRSDDINKDIT